MSAEKNWQFELEEYIKQGEPGQIEKSEAQQTAIGFQSLNLTLWNALQRNWLFWISLSKIF